MDDLGSVLCAIAAISLLCYGFWAVVIWVIRSAYSSDPSRQTQGHCPECGSRLRYGNRCSVCGERLADGPVTLEQELRSAARRIRQFAESGTIDNETAEKVDKAITDTFDRLRSGAPRPQKTAPTVERDLTKSEPEPKPTSSDEEPSGEFDDLFEEDAPKVEQKKPHPKLVADSVMEVVDFDSEPEATEVEPVDAVVVEVSQDQPAEEVELDKLIAAMQSSEETHSLSAFLEKRNIRWGELVSGMLIVGSSIGLVISLWSTLKQAIPFFPALLFLLATAAIHSAGVYTLKRWRLKSTSQGLLIISALLVPLNFLAAISLSERDVEVTSPIYIFAVTVGVLGYGAITSSCGRLLMLRGWWLLPLGVLVPSVSQIVIARLSTPDVTRQTLWMLASPAFAAFLITVGSQLRMSGTWRRVTIRRSNELFLVLGTSAFALVMAMGLLSLKVEDVRWALSTLAPAISP